jgi:NAD-dependent deacetylase
MITMEKDIEKAVSLVKKLLEKKSIKSYALTGAGVSRGSNIPTFRDEDGLWEKYDFNEVATLDAWIKNPDKLWTIYQNEIPRLFNAKPNPGHYALVGLEENGLCDVVITQNADGLHQKAGSANVLEIHGNFTKAQCISCGKKKDFNEPPKEIPPKCDCGGMLRPAVIFFYESLPEEEIKKAVNIAKSADLAFIVGTSAEVVPAAYLPSYSKENGAIVLVFNREKTAHSKIADVFIKGRSEETLPLFIKKLYEK